MGTNRQSYKTAQLLKTTESRGAADRWPKASNANNQNGSSRFIGHIAILLYSKVTRKMTSLMLPQRAKRTLDTDTDML